MFFAPKTKKEVFTVKEFLAGERKESVQSETPRKNIIPAFGFMGLPDITHHTFFSLSFSGAYWVVFGVAFVALLSTFLEYYYRSKGNDRVADTIESVTRMTFPVAFYAFLYFGIVKTF